MKLKRFLILIISIICCSNLIANEKNNHQKIHHKVEKFHNSKERITEKIKVSADLKNLEKSKSIHFIDNKNFLRNYQSDEVTINTVYDYAKRGLWSQALKNSNDQSIKNFVEMLRYSAVKGKRESYDEYEIYNFLLSKYPSAIDNNLVSKMHKSKPFGTTNQNLDDYSISASKLIERYKKDYSLKNDVAFQQKVREVWHRKKFSNAADEKVFLENFSYLLSNEDHKIRLEKMLWEGDSISAERVFRRVDVKTRANAKNRLEIQESTTVDELFKRFNRLSKNDINRQVLLFDSIKWCEKHSMQREIFELLEFVPIENRTQNDQWWQLLRPQIRELLLTKNKKNFQLAYKLASSHGVSNKKIEYVDAEFFSGMITNEFLDNQDLAIKHFSNSKQFAQQDFRKSRASYWLGVSYERLDEKHCILKNNSKIRQDKKAQQNGKNDFSDLANKNFREASADFVTFYGQLALMKLGNLDILKSKLVNIFQDTALNTMNDPIFKYYYYSLLTHNSNLAKKLAKIITLSSQSKNNIAFIAGVANYLQMPDISTYIGNIALYNKGYLILEAVYPAPNYKYLQNNKSLNLAIIKRESGFECNTINDAGSRGKANGLMQIIPAAGFDVARNLGISYNHQALLNPQTNVMFGNHLLNTLVRKWSGSNILAIISYNAGSGSASKWVKKLGDPRLGSTNSDLKKKILWIEQIPFRETRYYLQSVLASMTIYNAILNQNEKVEMVLD